MHVSLDFFKGASALAYRGKTYSDSTLPLKGKGLQHLCRAALRKRLSYLGLKLCANRVLQS